MSFFVSNKKFSPQKLFPSVQVKKNQMRLSLFQTFLNELSREQKYTQRIFKEFNKLPFILISSPADQYNFFIIQSKKFLPTTPQNLVQYFLETFPTDSSLVQF